jgi:hypothetical protein
MSTKKFFILLIISVSIPLLNIENISALSPSVKSGKDYIFAIETMRELRIMMENFGTDEQKQKYTEIKGLFKKASEQHYALEFIKPAGIILDIEKNQGTDDKNLEDRNYYSLELFRRLKLELSTLYNQLSLTYMQRTQEILDSTSSQCYNVIIEFSKNSGTAKYFYQPVNPLTQAKPYRTEEYHLYHDREKIEAYLHKGYESLQHAKNIYNYYNFKYIRNKKIKKDGELDYILEQHQTIIKLCRKAKQYGIEIHKVLKNTQLGDILKKYNVTLKTITRYPIYDDRIPESYKLDAVDNRNLVFTIEKERIARFSRRRQIENMTSEQ